MISNIFGNRCKKGALDLSISSVVRWILLVLVVVLVGAVIFGIGITKTINLLFPNFYPTNSTAVSGGGYIDPNTNTGDNTPLGISKEVRDKAIEKNCLLVGEIRDGNIFEFYKVKDVPKIRETNYYMKDNEIWKDVTWPFFNKKIGVITEDDKYGKVAVIEYDVIKGLDSKNLLSWMHYSYILNNKYFCKKENIKIPEVVEPPKPIEPTEKKCGDCVFNAGWTGLWGSCGEVEEIIPEPIEPGEKCTDCGDGFWNRCDEKECESIIENCVFIPLGLTGWWGDCRKGEEDVVPEGSNVKLYTTTTNLKSFRMLSKEELDAYLSYREKSDLLEYSEVIIQSAIDNGIDPYYVFSHFVHETGWGTSTIWKEKNNPFGIGAYDKCPLECAKTFESKEEGIQEGVKWIRDRYLCEKGESDKCKYSSNNLKEMNIYYATDKEWASKITNIINNLNSYVLENYPKDSEETA